MSKWKAPLPKNNPQEGVSLFVLAAKNHLGTRAEMSGEMSTRKMQLIFRLAQMSDSDIEAECQEMLTPNA
ncbi:MAG: hypothetical protein WC023_01730 [Rhodocyclaceae bacterium]